MPETSPSLWREPLLHFLIAGAAIFAVNAWRGPDVSPGSDRVVVSVDQVERMAVLWSKTWGRPPTEAELQGIVRDHIKEEVYYREAIRLGLDINDTVIRRRLRQKMEFLSLDPLEAIVPDDTVLRSWFEDNAARYQIGPSYTFEQIYFSPDGGGEIDAVLRGLRAGGSPDRVGDSISLPRTVDGQTEDDITRIFGEQFYRALDGVSINVWQGPIRSGFGQHLVKISSIEAANPPRFEDVQRQVTRDWMAEERVRAEDVAYEALRDRYKIEIESPRE